ncbi:T9SS type A sorting domain-containing protein [Aquimarina algicola]|uniref:T9SS type A sorting domain-containing protein n=1 Tax=Aquimarina algicola TaxID=2589995 RepID=A0A504JM41_9FLAO|nr:T9SS type A sorting domain-containing protein [Aquimarina algicola]TPN87520.1 T9SS type A sorting domain-containing protein [Aquimarina algicola]
MKKIYLLIICIGLVCLSFSPGIQAQPNDPEEKQEAKSVKIEGLRLFPNPAPAGSVLYVTSDLELTKTVTIYTVLGEKVLFKVLIGKELDISHLNPGVYVINVTEGDTKATLKLIID